MHDYVIEITCNMDTEIEGRFGILEPIRWPFRYSLDDSVAVSVCSGRFGGRFGILGPIRYSYVPPKRPPNRPSISVFKCENTESDGPNSHVTSLT